jgi:hypothetical protein
LRTSLHEIAMQFALVNLRWRKVDVIRREHV